MKAHASIQGTVLWGANRIYAVQTNQGTYECRIKGKVLTLEHAEHNPLAAGDEVRFIVHDNDNSRGLYGSIIERCPRSNVFQRWNKKSDLWQNIACNITTVVCVSSVNEPQFRPRFIDRLLILAERAGIKAVLVINKDDLWFADMKMHDVLAERIHYFRTVLNISVICCSVRNNSGLDAVASLLDQRVLFVGQSGVGKSSLINALFSQLQLREGHISQKYNRGRHTTTISRMYPHMFCVRSEKNVDVIDSPGIKELGIYGIPTTELWHYFSDFIPHALHCELINCTHMHESVCGIIDAVQKGTLLADRYEAYSNLFVEIEAHKAQWELKNKHY